MFHQVHNFIHAAQRPSHFFGPFGCGGRIGVMGCTGGGFGRGVSGLSMGMVLHMSAQIVRLVSENTYGFVLVKSRRSARPVPYVMYASGASQYCSCIVIATCMMRSCDGGLTAVLPGRTQYAMQNTIVESRFGKAAGKAALYATLWRPPKEMPALSSH